MLILITDRVPRGSVFFQIQGVHTLLIQLTVTATKPQGWLEWANQVVIQTCCLSKPLEAMKCVDSIVASGKVF